MLSLMFVKISTNVQSIQEYAKMEFAPTHKAVLSARAQKALSSATKI